MKRILVAIDMSDMSYEALKRGILLAKEKEAQLIVMHVIDQSFIDSVIGQLIDKTKLKQKLIDKIDKLNIEINIDYLLFLEFGSVISSINLKVKEINADLLVIGTHGQDNIISNYFGSTALKLIQSTHIPILIVKNNVNNSYKKMLSPTNLSDYSKESILFANNFFDNLTQKYLYAYEDIDVLMATRYHVSIEQQLKFKKELHLRATQDLEKFTEDIKDGDRKLMASTAFCNED